MTYLRNAALFRGVEMTACADLLPEQAALRAAEYGLRAMPVAALIADPAIDLILNLTIPAAHADITRAALAAGKHVFTEKPLATSVAEGARLVEEAAAAGLLLGSAPDTFLGAAGRQARHLLDEGVIGRVITGTAFMMGRGMEHWHPNPAFYYQPGGGPVLDMGPYYITMLVNLLGPARRVMAMGAQAEAERLITAAGPRQGARFAVGTQTTLLSLIEFASGAIIAFGASWDVYRHSQVPIELHGTLGSLQLPDPDAFGGRLGLSRGGAAWEEIDTAGHHYGALNWPYAAPDRANYRMLGIADLSAGLRDGRPPRASGTLALHVLEVLEAILRASDSGRPVDITTSVAQPAPLSEADAHSYLV
jgi:predicted dehydrogenase